MGCQETEETSANETEDFSPYAFLSTSQINTLLEAQDLDEVQRLIEEILNFKDPQTDLKEAVLVDYYVSGFLTGKDMNFNPQQLTGLMWLLHFLIENIEAKQMSLEENITELGKAFIGIGHSPLKTTGKLTFLNVEQAKDIINYIKISLFQHYKLYECLFTVPRDQMVIGAEVRKTLILSNFNNLITSKNLIALLLSLHKQVIEIAKPAETPFPTPLEEGIFSEIYTKFIAPPAPKENTENIMDATLPAEHDKKENLSDEDNLLSVYSIDEVKTVLEEVTADAIDSLQVEINEKLRVQEEAFVAKIENLKKP
ncbi:ciliary-associated calcium-binding coiled-coil protein 1 isoform X2 [Pseudophryne corroboree]|uniref:ciliary-associated calcium-binding coiled-coil protein 1 isoform X2 n=1 Tax=Pseudophryne corroboree TaxID=495146 RepID=UPI00308145AF